MKKIVVAYSGGLDTSVLLLWLKEKYNAEIIAYCADVGQGDELDGLEAKALSTGASKCYIGDLKENFATNYIFPMIQAGAIYEGRYLLGTSIARPCITADMIKIAMISIHQDIKDYKLGSKMTMQVHDELVFDVLVNETEIMKRIITERMKNAIKMQVPILVEVGEGKTWLEAH
jgi:argininosuccinate synthase